MAQLATAYEVDEDGSVERDPLVHRVGSEMLPGVWAADVLRGGPDSNGVSFAIAVDNSGSIYTTGYFRGTADFDPGTGNYSLTATPDGNANLFSDAFVSKLVPSSSATSAAAATDAETESLLRSVSQAEGS